MFGGRYLFIFVKKPCSKLHCQIIKISEDNIYKSKNKPWVFSPRRFDI